MAPEPPADEEVLHDDHADAHEHRVGDAEFAVAGQAIAAEDEAADDGLQQVVGEAGAAEGAEVAERPAEAGEGVPGRNDGRDDHQQDAQVVDGLEPGLDGAEVHDAQRQHGHGGGAQ